MDVMNNESIAYIMANNKQLPENLVLRHAVSILSQRLTPQFVADENGDPIRLNMPFSEQRLEEFKRQKKVLLERLLYLSRQPSKG